MGEIMKYTQEQLVTILQDFANELGKTPSLQDYRNKKIKPSPATIFSVFGSWDKALIAAGFDKHVYKSKEDLLNYLVEYYNTHGEAPSTRKFDAITNYPNSVTYKRNFGSWNKALELAGLPIKQRKPKIPYSKDYIVGSIIEYIKKYNKIPTTNEFDADKNFPSSITVVKYCGSWENAIRDAGYTPDIGSGFGIYTKALDGNTYRSKAEAYFVDTYLFDKYSYIIEPSYPKPEERRRYDWYIKELDVYIELDGGCRPNIITEKVAINKRLNIDCAIIPVKNIYLNKTLIELIEDFKIR